MSEIQIVVKNIPHLVKKIGILIPVFFILIQSSLAQTHEIGAGIGAFNYSGELSPVYNPVFYRPGGTLFYRFNPTPVIALRTGFYFGNLYAKDSGKNPLPELRDASFHTSIEELSVIVEYNFLNYRALNDPVKFSPYLAGGLGMFVSSSYQYGNSFNACIPLGIGIKYKLGKQFNLGAELIARKTFTDNLDGISSDIINNHETANFFDKDWYYYTGINISYTFYDVKCPQRLKFKY